MDWRTFLIIIHIIGVVFGTGGATFAEVFVTKALVANKIDEYEHSFLRLTYLLLRVGMILIVLSGFGLFLWYRFTNQTYLLYTPRMWMKLTLIFIIVLNAIGLQTRTISLWLGSAISLTSWYGALILGAWAVHAPFSTMFIVYLVSIGLVAITAQALKNIFVKTV